MKNEHVNPARVRVEEITAKEACALHTSGSDTLFVDVRETNEWNLGHIPGALHIPRGRIESDAGRLLPRESRILLYCASGSRSALAAASLAQMGYTSVASISDGWRGWIAADGEVADG